MAKDTINFTPSSTTTSGSYIEGKIDWVSEANTSTGTSRVTANLYVRKANATTTLTIPTEGTWTYSMTVNGVSWTGSVSKPVLESWVLLTTRTSGDIPHDVGGAKSITISGSITAPAATSFKGLETNGSGTAQLDNITRATAIDSLTCSSTYADGVITAKYTPRNSGYYNRRIMYVNVNGSLTKIHTVDLGTKAASQQTHNMQFNADELSLICTKVVNTAKATIRVTFQTYYDSGYKTQIGQDQYLEISLLLPLGIAPTAALNITPVNSNSWINSKNIYVAGLSGATAVLSAGPGEGATLSSTTITYDGVVHNTVRLNVTTLTKSGNIEFVAKATDSRGRTATDPKTITVLPYSAPAITKLQVERGTYDSEWEAAEDGPDVRAVFNTTLALTDKDNTYTTTFKLDNSVISPDHGDVSGLSSGTEYTVYFVNLDGEASHTLTMTATDRAGGVGTAQLVIPTIHITIEFNDSGKGIAFGKTSEKDAFECDWDAEFNKDVSVEGELQAKHIARLDYYNGKNFNNLIYNTGYYTGTAAPSSTGCTNYPANVTGVLEVISQMAQNTTTGNWWGFAYQTYKTHEGKIYNRSYYSDKGWTDWVMQDNIVEQGTSGIWIYRKWSSGLAECWGVSDAITQTTSTDWNIMTSNTGTPAISYPFTFKNPPVVSPSVHIHNGNFWLVTMSAGTTTQTPTYQIARGKSATTITFKLGYYVFGQWK